MSRAVKRSQEILVSGTIRLGSLLPKGDGEDKKA